jgi:hypothetical protein
MKEETALQRIDPQALIKSAVENGAGIETMERLVALAKDVRAQQASEAWHHAMSEFQRTCPPINKTKTAQIATRTGRGYSYNYAPLGEIMTTILPVMGPLGLSTSFRVRHEEGKVIASCRVSHELGHHEESGDVAMPVQDTGGVGANPAQQVGIASTYAKRYALLAIIGLAPEDDPDASDRPGKPQAIEQPKRASEKPKGGQWDGTIKAVGSKKGETKGKPWTLYKITGTDGLEFKTFKEDFAEFARAAGSSKVTIVFTEGTKGGFVVTDIMPFQEQPPLPE